MDTAEKKHVERPLGISVERIERIDGRPSDFYDPHRAALEENPDHAERPSARTILAVLVCALIGRSQRLINEFSPWLCPISVQLRVDLHCLSPLLRR